MFPYSEDYEPNIFIHFLELENYVDCEGFFGPLFGKILLFWGQFFGIKSGSRPTHDKRD